jgi:hydroxyethylthiazole kinase-like sugar kinase family protein
VRESEEVVTYSKEVAVNTGLVTNESKEKYTEIKTHATNLEQDLIINV